MGCDIHVRAEKLVDDTWEVISELEPFSNRNYGIFGFLADVRNYSAVPPIAAPRGLPAGYDPNDWLGDHSFSWLLIEELTTFDYDQEFEDRRVMRQTGRNTWNGGVTGEPGEGKIVTFREFLGAGFFEDLERLKATGTGRIVFGFDS